MARRQFFDTLPYERYKFEKEQLGVAFSLTKKQFEDMKGWEIERYETNMGYEIVWRVSRLMAHGDRTTTSTEDVPVSWWDHLKLDVNLWALEHLKRRCVFFHPARLIAYLPITPKFRRIEKSILIKRFCPHVDSHDNRPHIEFMIGRPLDMKALFDNEYRFPYDGRVY